MQAKGFPEEKNSTQHTRSSAPDDLENAKARSASAAAIALRETMQVLQNPRSRRGRQPRQPVHPVCPSKAGANSRNMARTAEENPHPPRGRHDGSRRRDRGGIEFLRSS